MQPICDTVTNLYRTLLGLERHDTKEEELLWIIARYVHRKGAYGEDCALSLLKNDAIQTRHFKYHEPTAILDEHRNCYV
jgi:hypothetical protein